jgi:hypothetical protein
MQQGQVFELKKRAVDGRPVWAYRYRTDGPGSRRLQRGGFSSERDAAEALERALEHLRRQKGVGSTLTLKELVEEYLAQYDAEPETIDKLCWLLAKALRAFGGRRLPELRSQEIAAWRMTISPGHRFEATQALRQVLNRAVAWKLIDENPAKRGCRTPVGAAGSSGHSNPGRRSGRSPARCCSRTPVAAISTSATSTAATGSRSKKQPGSSCCATSTTCATPTRRSRSVPACRYSRSHGSWARASR